MQLAGPALVLSFLAPGFFACGAPDEVPAARQPAAYEPHPDWPATKAWVRETFPDAPVVSVATLQVELEGGGEPPLLFDARAPAEFAVSHLAGARNVPDLDAALRLLEGRVPSTEVVVYCSVGYRSGDMTQALGARGFRNVRNLEGSLFEWANAGLPLYRGEREVRTVHPFDAEWGRLLRRELWQPLSVQGE